MSYNNNEIEFCEWCGCEEFTQRIVDRIEHTECEVEYLCENCKKIVNYWEYGYFQNPITSEYLKLKQNRLRTLKIKEIEKINGEQKI